jgi:prolyl-tRNA editing enzyme YbaK/EbsC (Cys-tRNA(Pro) deacylase)
MIKLDRYLCSWLNWIKHRPPKLKTVGSNPTEHTLTMNIGTILNNSGCKIRVFDQSTRTALEAAKVLGCDVAQIAKSLIFRTESGRPVLVVTSEINRVNEEKIGQILGEKINKADADFVRSETGYVIGGVPPFGFEKEIVTLVDEDLLRYPDVWASAGAINSVFRMETKRLIEMTKGQIVGVK